MYRRPSAALGFLIGSAFRDCSYLSTLGLRLMLFTGLVGIQGPTPDRTIELLLREFLWVLSIPAPTPWSSSTKRASHLSTKLIMLDNITLLPLPSRSPELNPVENVWQFMRDNWLSSRVFQTYNDIVSHCREA